MAPFSSYLIKKMNGWSAVKTSVDIKSIGGGVPMAVAAAATVPVSLTSITALWITSLMYMFMFSVGTRE